MVKINKKAQGGMSGETLVGLLVILAVGGLLIWGVSSNWWGAVKQVEPYTGGASILGVSTNCGLYCGGGASSTVPYCSSGLQIVNSLEFAQLNMIKAQLSGGSCEDKNGNAIATTDATACKSAKKGIWKSGISLLNYYTLQAKASCGTLAKAGLIDGCDDITCS